MDYAFLEATSGLKNPGNGSQREQNNHQQNLECIVEIPPLFASDHVFGECFDKQPTFDYRFATDFGGRAVYKRPPFVDHKR